MKFLLAYCGRKTLAVLFLTSLGALLLDLGSVALIFPFLRLFVSPELVRTHPFVRPVFDGLGFRSPEAFIVVAALALVVAYIMRLALMVALKGLRFHVIGGVTLRLATDLLRRLLGAKYALFTAGSPSEMFAAINSHTINGMMCLDASVTIANELSLMVALVGFLLYLNVHLTLALIVVFGVTGLALYFGIVVRIVEYGKIHARLNVTAYTFCFAAATAIKDIKIMGLEESYATRFATIWHDYTTNDARAKNARSFPVHFSETVVFSAIIAACPVILVSGASAGDVVPMLGVLAVSAMRTLPSFNRVIAAFNEYKFLRAYLAKVEELSAKVDANRHEVRRVEQPFVDRIELRGLGLRYGEKQVLRALSCTIPKNGAVAFVGTSGAGKSTLLDVIVGLRQADEGTCLVDGAPVDVFATDVLKRRIGYVPQHVSLVDDTIAFNISFEERPDPQKMARILRVARLETYVSELARGLDTVIGENGVRVSGGQRQRIGIARALFRDPEILVFDEATSSLDAITERELMAEIEALAGTKTLIIAAHRLATVERCDIIYVLHEGTIVGQGTHGALLESCPQYARLYREQAA